MFMPNMSFRDALDAKIMSQNQFGYGITNQADKATRSATVFGNKIHMYERTHITVLQNSCGLKSNLTNTSHLIKKS